MIRGNLAPSYFLWRPASAQTALFALLLAFFCGRVRAQGVPVAAAPPLTDSQLAELRNISLWRVEYHVRLTEDSLGSGTDTLTGGTLSTPVSRWIHQRAIGESFDVIFFVSGNPGCGSSGTCHVDYSVVGSAALHYDWRENELLSLDHCALQSDGSIGPGQQQMVRTRLVNTGSLALDGTPDPLNDGAHAGHTVDRLSFLIDPATNPPRAFVNGEVLFAGTGSTNFSGCLRNQVSSGLDFETEDAEIFFNANPNVVLTAASVGDSQVRVEGGEFVIHGEGDRIISAANDPAHCLVASFSFASPGIQPNLSCSTQLHEHRSWVIRPVRSPLSIAGLEVTQATQTMQSPTDLEAGLLASDGKPPIPVVAGKPAALRVYLAKAPDTTSAELDLTLPDTSLGAAFTLTPGCTPDNRRRQENAAAFQCRSVDAYFTPPEGSWSATVTLKDDQGHIIETHTFPFRSVTTKPLSLLPVKVCDAQAGSDLLCGSLAQFSALLPFIRSTYPGSVNRAITLSGPLNRFTATGGWDQWWIPLLGDIGNLWTADGKPSDVYYFGVVRSLLPDPPGTGSIGGGGNTPGHAAAGRTSWTVSNMSGANVDDAAQVVAHEIGHNIGRNHVPSPAAFGCYGNPAHLDPGWPYGNTPLVQEVGFDVANGKAVLPEAHADWMSYCTPRWISPYTYKALLAGAASGSGSSSAISSAARSAGPFWLVSGTIQDAAASLDPLFLMDAIGDNSQGNGPDRIELRDSGGNLLFTRYFEPSEVHFANLEGPPRFSELLPVLPAARIAVLASDGTELAARDITGAPPAVQVTFPAGGEFLSGVRTLLWSVRDPDSVQHSFWVQYSADDGHVWRTIAAGIDANELAVDFDTLPGSSTARIRVLASDGANTGAAVSAPFTVSLKPPAAHISFPDSGSVFRKGQLVWLQAFTLDPEDGFLDGPAVRWQSDRDGDLGSGAELHATTLSVGEHHITLTVTDTAGNQVTDSITIRIADADFNEASAPASNDTTAPATTAGVSPPANSSGWDKDIVTLTLSANDPDGSSDVKQITFGAAGAQAIAPTTVAGNSASLVILAEGQTTITFFATDDAGNSESPHAVTIKLDRTPPVISATANPPANANGWNNSDVTVSFAAVDALSGIDAVSAPVTLTSEGARQSLAGSATDKAGNLAVVGATVNIDKTPPEAFSQFDPATRDLAVFGRDSLSGVPPGPLTPISLVPANPGEDCEHSGADHDDGEHAEIRTYRILDAAGNALLLVQRVKKEGHEIKASLASLQYADGPVLAAPPNEEAFEWALAKDGNLSELEQRIEVQGGKDRRVWKAKYDARKNQTTIEQEDSQPETKIVEPGLVLLRLATAKGALAVEF